MQFISLESLKLLAKVDINRRYYVKSHELKILPALEQMRRLCATFKLKREGQIAEYHNYKEGSEDRQKAWLSVSWFDGAIAAVETCIVILEQEQK